MHTWSKVTIDNVFVLYVAENSCLYMALQHWTQPLPPQGTVIITVFDFEYVDTGGLCVRATYSIPIL